MAPPWWVTLVGLVITGLLGWAAQAWSSRGKTAVDLNNIAIKMVETVEARVKRLEEIDSWRTVCATLDSDHIAILRDHIYRELPPPPPNRPSYPPRPAS